MLVVVQVPPLFTNERLAPGPSPPLSTVLINPLKPTDIVAVPDVLCIRPVELLNSRVPLTTTVAPPGKVIVRVDSSSVVPEPIVQLPLTIVAPLMVLVPLPLSIR